MEVEETRKWIVALEAGSRSGKWKQEVEVEIKWKRKV